MAEDPYLKLNIHFAFSFEPFITDPTSKIANAVKDAVKMVYGEEREFKMFQSANDGHFFAEKGIPTVIMGTGTHENNVHAQDEFVYVKDLIKTTKIFALTVLNFFID